jgi:hypothetical protein
MIRTAARRRLVPFVVLAVLATAVPMIGVLVPVSPAAAATCGGAFAPPFTDVPLDHPFCNEIRIAKTFGVVDGYPDGTFRGGQPITRQAVAAMLFDAATADSGMPPPICPFRPYPDVPTNHPFCGEIMLVSQAGIFTGYDDGTFRPNNPITRQATAAVVTRFPDATIVLPNCAGAPYPDVPVDHPFCDNILTLLITEVATGYPDGTFRPADNITRQAFVAILVRWIEVLDT